MRSPLSIYKEKNTMKKFEKMSELVSYLLDNEPTEEVTKDILFCMHTVEACNKQGANSALVIAQNELNESELKELNILGFEPEIDEEIKAGGEVWKQRIYVLSSDGAGVVLFEKLPSPS